MRKVITILLIFVMIFSSVALAELDNPFETMTDDEIIICYKFTVEQIKKRGISTSVYGWLEGSKIEPGVYIVGEDIPAGSYYFEGVEGRYTTSINVLSSLADKKYILDISNIGYGQFAQNPKSGKVILEDGWYVEIVQGPAIIHLWEGIGFD